MRDGGGGGGGNHCIQNVSHYSSLFQRMKKKKSLLQMYG